MNLNDVLVGKKKARKRVGRGDGSGLGKTCGKGHKGQKARSGAKMRIQFEGGQMPLFRRTPKVGFSQGRFKKDIVVVNVAMLNRFEDGSEVRPEDLVKAGVAKWLGDGVKILGEGTLERKLTVFANKFSRSAREKIEAAGGEAKEL